MRRVLVDTNIWSAFLRRPPAQEEPLRKNFFELVESSRLVLIGPIRQEILSGIRDPMKFETLRESLEGFQDEEILTKDYEEAARLRNRCAAQGIASTSIDLLMAAFAIHRGFDIYTRDNDFLRYQQIAKFDLFQET